ncbi:MAG: signal peptidase I [Frankiales bacterium]|nr:signal peptidase I [Frankiales bacterium]
MPAVIRTLRLLGVAALAATLWLALSPTALGGDTSYVSTRGISMAPRFSTGDLAVVRSAQSYAVGDVVAYRSSTLKTIVMHRIVAVDNGRFTFKGDNNDFLDRDTPTQEQFLGKLAIRIPQGGVWLKRFTSPPALAAYTFLLLAGGTTAVTRRRRRLERRLMSPRHRSTTMPTLGAFPPALQPLAAGAAALAIAGIALAGLSFTRPTTTTAAADTSASMAFGYRASVALSAAYDGTTVVAPQPVFRTLTDAVDVTFTYTGRPGRIAVDAELSTAGGWRSTLPLAAPRTVATGQQGVVRLQLSALAAKALAAAQVTGIPPGPLTVTVQPKIWLDGGGQFAPNWALTLNDSSLSIAEPLTAKAAITIAGTREAPARLSALGHGMEVSTARTTSLVALALAALAGLALTTLARLSGPVADTERVRARHKDLLLAVLPITLTPGRPVVDVTDVEALVRLAERYGLLVLHWQRSGVTTYVVQDEGATYRFRSWVATAADQPVIELAGA